MGRDSELGSGGAEVLYLERGWKLQCMCITTACLEGQYDSKIPEAILKRASIERSSEFDHAVDLPIGKGGISAVPAQFGMRAVFSVPFQCLLSIHPVSFT